MKYVVDMAKASADLDRVEERSKKLNYANTSVLAASALCIAVMTVISILRGPTGVFNALLILLGLFVISSYVMLHLMKPMRMNARFYKMTRGCKLLGMYTESCKDTLNKGEWVIVSVEDANGDVQKHVLGKVKKVENTNYTEPVLNLDHERLYVPYTGNDIAPEKVEEPKATNTEAVVSEEQSAEAQPEEAKTEE